MTSDNIVTAIFFTSVLHESVFLPKREKKTMNRFGVISIIKITNKRMVGVIRSSVHKLCFSFCVTGIR